MHTVPFERGSGAHTEWYKALEMRHLCTEAVEKKLDKLLEAKADANDVDFKELCASAELSKYEKTTVAESIKLLMKHKKKPWTLGEDDTGIGEISYDSR